MSKPLGAGVYARTFCMLFLFCLFVILLFLKYSYFYFISISTLFSAARVEMITGVTSGVIAEVAVNVLVPVANHGGLLK